MSKRFKVVLALVVLLLAGSLYVWLGQGNGSSDHGKLTPNCPKGVSPKHCQQK